MALLEDMIIHPERRDSGLGYHLLNSAIAYARAQGCLRVTLLTDSDNRPAQALYAKAGFKASKMIPMRLFF